MVVIRFLEYEMVVGVVDFCIVIGVVIVWFVIILFLLLVWFLDISMVYIYGVVMS